MRFELGSITVDDVRIPALDIPGVGIVPFIEDETGGYVMLTREQQIALKKELD
jgi:hypothetical protein